MDNQSNDSDHQPQITASNSKKPNNRNRFSHKGLSLRSDFPGGNLQAVSFQQQFRMVGKIALVIEFWGNSDAQADQLDKSWFYFKVTGIRDMKNMKYQEIIFRFKNANNYRKFIREKVFKPYVVVKQEIAEGEGIWSIIFLSKINVLQNEVIQAEFVYQIQPGVDVAYFAENLPYNMADIQAMHQRNIQQLQNKRNNRVYYHREIITESLDEHPTYLLTITSAQNILTDEKSEPQLFIFKDKRPFILKNRPQIMITSRVHPSETSSSFCLEGIIESLMSISDFAILLDMFIFRIVPMVNPDGVQNGHYRLDNNLQNLNRYYGHSNPSKTPTVYAIEKLITFLRQRSKLFMFIDIHGHNSPKPSFIFGNFSQNLYQLLQNRSLVKILQIFSEGLFDSMQCEFSKKNMTIKQKYDEHSKQASARVFAYRGNSQQENNRNPLKSQIFVEHSYTLQIHPFIIRNGNIRKSILRKQSKEISNSTKTLPKSVQNLAKIDELSQNSITSNEIIIQYKKIGENVLKTILQLVGINFYQLSQTQSTSLIRRRILKDLGKQVQFYDRVKRTNYKQISRQVIERYDQKWKILEGYSQFINSMFITQITKQRLKNSLINEVYQQWCMKKLQVSKKLKLNRNKSKEKTSLKEITDKMEEFEQSQRAEKREEQIEEREELTIISYPVKRNQKEIEKLKKSTALKSIEFDSSKRMESRQLIQRNIIYADVKNQGNSLSPTKRMANSRNSQLEQIERKIRRLIFRHKTENQIIPATPQENYSQQKVTLQLPHRKTHQNTEGQSSKNEKQAKELQDYFSGFNCTKLEPLAKYKKNKLAHLKTQMNRSPDFNDLKIINSIEKRSSFTEIKKQEFEERVNPRIQEYTKKIEEHKQEMRTIAYQPSQYQQAKFSTISNRKNKSLSRNQQARPDGQRYKIFQINDNPKNLKGFHSIMNLPQMPQQNNIHQEVYTLGNNPISKQQKQKLIGCHQSVKNKLKKMQIIKTQQNQKMMIGEIVQSFRIVASEINNKYQLQRPKNASEKKRDSKNFQQTYLPTINQIQFIEGGRKSK